MTLTLRINLKTRGLTAGIIYGFLSHLLIRSEFFGAVMLGFPALIENTILKYLSFVPPGTVSIVIGSVLGYGAAGLVERYLIRKKSSRKLLTDRRN